MLTSSRRRGVPDAIRDTAAERTLVMRAAVEVRAAAAEVFQVVSDLRVKARLNPAVEVIRVELLGGEPVREGSAFWSRVLRQGRIVEYRSRCVRFEPPHRFATRSETDPSFEVAVTVEPRDDGGCRLVQEETLVATPALLDALEPPPGPRGLAETLAWMGLIPAVSALGEHVRDWQQARIAERFTGELLAWLEAIKAHLERGRAADRRAGGTV